MNSDLELSHEAAAAETLPLRDAFAATSSSVSMLFDLAILLRDPWPVLCDGKANVLAALLAVLAAMC